MEGNYTDLLPSSGKTCGLLVKYQPDVGSAGVCFAAFFILAQRAACAAATRARPSALMVWCFFPGAGGTYGACDSQ